MWLLLALVPGEAIAKDLIAAEFWGIWRGSDLSPCHDVEWTDGKMLIDAKGVRGWEHGCSVVSFRRLPSPPSDASKVIASVQLQCAGEGQAWRETGEWLVHMFDELKVMIQVVKVENLRDELTRKPMGPPYKDFNVFVSCKARPR